MHLGRIVGRGWPLLTLAVALGAAAAIFYRPFSGAESLEYDQAGVPADVRPVGTALTPVITPGTTVAYRIMYTPCARAEETSAPAPAALVGLGEPDLGRLYPQWSVVEFVPGRVVLQRETDELCAEFRQWRHVRLVNGVVTVFYGRLGSNLVKEQTTITADQLPAADRLRLMRGVELQGDDAVRAYLESGP